LGKIEFLKLLIKVTIKNDRISIVTPNTVVAMDALYDFAITPIMVLPIIEVDEDKKFIEKILPI